MAKKKIKEIDKPLPVEDFYATMEKRILAAKNEASAWRSNQERWHKLRMRIKKTKTFPFTGCANLRMPTAETKLRKVKSNLVKVIFGNRPIVQAIPSPSGDLQIADKIAKWVDHLIMDVMEFLPKGIITIDQAIEKGFYLLKPYWRTEITTRIETLSLDELDMEEAMGLYGMETQPPQIAQNLIERLEVDMQDKVAEDNEKEINRAVSEILAGKGDIKLSLQDVLYDAPDGALCNPEFVYANSDARYHPQDARLLVHELFVPYDQVKRNVELKDWDQAAVNEIDNLKSLNRDNLTENTKASREGVDRINNPSQLVKIWECYTYYDLNGDGFQEKCLFTFAPEFHVTLRKITLPFDNGKFPFIKVINELTDDRWYGHRGLPEFIEDLIKEIDTQHNQKLDGQTWRNTPMWSYRAGVVNPNLIKPTPGQAIPRHDKDDLTLMQNTNLNADYSYEKEQMLLETKIEELIGQIDFSLHSMINKRQPRTLGEVDHQVSAQQMVFSLDASIYTMAFSEFFSYIWDLWCQYGDDETEFKYFGENGWEDIKLSKEEVQGKYKILVRGNDQNFNPQVRQQKAQMYLTATLNETAMRMGIIQPVNVYNAYKRFYQTMDEQNWQDFITDPQQLPQQTPPPPPIKMAMDDLTVGEQAQVKSKHGIQPDIQGSSLNKEEERSDKEFEQEMEVLKNAPRPESPK